MRSFFPRLGGKSKISKKICALIPSDIKIYVEPFLGGGSIFFRKPVSPVEVLNDICPDVFHMFTDMLKHGHYILGYNFVNSREKFNLLKTQNPVDPKERLFRNLYISKYSFAANRINFNPKAIHTLKHIKRNVPKYQKRLKNAVILNQDFETVIAKYDCVDAFFYLDPPYENGKTELWNYKPITALKMLSVCEQIKGRFLMSFNNTTTVRTLFKDFNVREISVPYSCTQRGSVKYTELLINNYLKD